MLELLTPGVYFERARRGPRPLAAVRTDVAGFVGLAERGPVDEAVRVTSWLEFRALFGSFLPYAYLAYAVKAFFDNGGRAAWCVRVAAGAATARATLADRLAVPTLEIAASSPGAWGNELAVGLALESPSATLTAPRPQPADGSASRVASAAGFDAGALVRIFQAEPAPVESWRVAAEVDKARGTLVWEAPLAGFDLTDPAARPLSFETVELELTVYRRGRLVERLAGLTPVPGHRRSAERIAAGAAFVRLRDLQRAAAPSPWPDRLPALAGGGRPVPLSGGRDGLAALAPRHFTGEPDTAAPGLAETAAAGLAVLERVDEVAIVAIPDVHARPAPPPERAPLPPPEIDPCLCDGPPEPLVPPAEPVAQEQPPAFTDEEVYAVQQALVDHCERLRDRFAILDPPELGASGLDGIRAWRRRFDSPFAALYHPWVRVLDPRRAAGADTDGGATRPGRARADALRAVPPSGHVAGVYARTDLAAGVHKAPANEELRWAQGFAAEIDDGAQAVLNLEGVNALRAFPGRGLRVFGARTTTADAAWRYVNVRRLVTMIEETLEESMQWVVFEPNDSDLRRTLALSISSFLRQLWAAGALAGARPAEAFFVKCDADLNPPDLIELGRLVALVGVAPTRPAEFVVVRLGRIGDALEVRALDSPLAAGLAGGQP